MALFKKKKDNVNEEVNKNEELRDMLSEAYDDIMKNGVQQDNNAEKADNSKNSAPVDLSNEIFEMNVRKFQKEKNQENLLAVLRMLPGRKFIVPSISNMDESIERDGDKIKLKEGVVLNPALLTAKDGKVFIPLFTKEKEMVQKSPSGINLRMKFEQCVSMVFNDKNPIWAVVINPFTDNMIIGEDLLRQMFVPVEKEENKKSNQ